MKAPTSDTPWRLEDTERSPCRLISPSGDCVARVYLTPRGSKPRTPESVKRAHDIVTALNWHGVVG